MECWIIVDNVHDIGVRALTDFFQDFNPRKCLRLDDKTACIEFFSKEDAKNAVQAKHCTLIPDNLGGHSSVSCRIPRDKDARWILNSQEEEFEEGQLSQPYEQLLSQRELHYQRKSSSPDRNGYSSHHRPLNQPASPLSQHTTPPHESPTDTKRRYQKQPAAPDRRKRQRQLDLTSHRSSSPTFHDQDDVNDQWKSKARPAPTKATTSAPAAQSSPIKKFITSYVEESPASPPASPPEAPSPPLSDSDATSPTSSPILSPPPVPSLQAAAKSSAPQDPFKTFFGDSPSVPTNFEYNFTAPQTTPVALPKPEGKRAKKAKAKAAQKGAATEENLSYPLVPQPFELDPYSQQNGYYQHYSYPYEHYPPPYYASYHTPPTQAHEYQHAAYLPHHLSPHVPPQLYPQAPLVPPAKLDEKKTDPRKDTTNGKKLKKASPQSKIPNTTEQVYYSMHTQHAYPTDQQAGYMYYLPEYVPPPPPPLPPQSPGTIGSAIEEKVQQLNAQPPKSPPLLQSPPTPFGHHHHLQILPPANTQVALHPTRTASRTTPAPKTATTLPIEAPLQKKIPPKLIDSEPEACEMELEYYEEVHTSHNKQLQLKVQRKPLPPPKVPRVANVEEMESNFEYPYVPNGDIAPGPSKPPARSAPPKPPARQGLPEDGNRNEAIPVNPSTSKPPPPRPKGPMSSGKQAPGKPAPGQAKGPGTAKPAPPTAKQPAPAQAKSAAHAKPPVAKPQAKPGAKMPPGQAKPAAAASLKPAPPSASSSLKPSSAPPSKPPAKPPAAGAKPAPPKSGNAKIAAVKPAQPKVEIAEVETPSVETPEVEKLETNDVDMSEDYSKYETYKSERGEGRKRGWRGTRGAWGDGEWYRSSSNTGWNSNGGSWGMYPQMWNQYSQMWYPGMMNMGMGMGGGGMGMGGGGGGMEWQQQQWQMWNAQNGYYFNNNNNNNNNNNGGGNGGGTGEQQVQSLPQNEQQQQEKNEKNEKLENQKIENSNFDGKSNELQNSGDSQKNLSPEFSLARSSATIPPPPLATATPSLSSSAPATLSSIPPPPPPLPPAAAPPPPPPPPLSPDPNQAEQEQLEQVLAELEELHKNQQLNERQMQQLQVLQQLVRQSKKITPTPPPPPPPLSSTPLPPPPSTPSSSATLRSSVPQPPSPQKSPLYPPPSPFLPSLPSPPSESMQKEKEREKDEDKEKEREQQGDNDTSSSSSSSSLSPEQLQQLQQFQLLQFMMQQQSLQQSQGGGGEGERDKQQEADKQDRLSPYEKFLLMQQQVIVLQYLYQLQANAQQQQENNEQNNNNSNNNNNNNSNNNGLNLQNILASQFGFPSIPVPPPPTPPKKVNPETAASMKKKIEMEAYDIATSDLLTVPRFKLRRAIVSRTFYIINFSSLIGNYIYPSEVAIYKVSFYGKTRQAIKKNKTFHSFINPGPIPPNLLSEAEQAKKITGVPYKNFGEAQLDYCKILKQICEFAGRDAIFYAKGPRFVADCLAWLSMNAGEVNTQWNVRSVEELVEQIHLCWDSTIPSSSAGNIFHSDAIPPLEFNCDFHRKEIKERISEIKREGANNNGKREVKEGRERLREMVERGKERFRLEKEREKERGKCVLGGVRMVVSVLKKLWKSLEKR